MRSIPLTQGQCALVDDDDYVSIMKHNWFAHRNYKTDRFYALRKKNGKHIPMHRHILNAPKGKFVDHINGNSLDNRRSNIRICSPKENTQNRRKSACESLSSRYKGVFSMPNSKKKPYVSKIFSDGKNIYLGRFSDEIDAAKAYDIAATYYYQAFAKTNFPFLDFSCSDELLGYYQNLGIRRSTKSKNFHCELTCKGQRHYVGTFTDEVSAFHSRQKLEKQLGIEPPILLRIIGDLKGGQSHRC